MKANERAAIEQVANALQTAVMLATRVRQRIGEQADDTMQLAAAVDRAARALATLKPQRGTP
jgi:hypothetical protein